MQLFAIILSALVAGLGATAVFLPDTFIEVARSLVTPVGLMVAAAFRILFGLALLLSAQGSRAPNLLRLFGALILIAGVASPLFGSAVAHRLLDAAAEEGGAWLRISGTIAIALCISFVMALTPRGNAPSRRM